MTLTKTYTCDICKKEEAEKDELFDVEISRHKNLIEAKHLHAHKECLIKVGLLAEQEAPVIEPNVFLSLAEGATATAADKAFLHIEEGSLLQDEEEGDD